MDTIALEFSEKYTAEGEIAILEKLFFKSGKYGKAFEGEKRPH